MDSLEIQVQLQECNGLDNNHILCTGIHSLLHLDHGQLLNCLDNSRKHCTGIHILYEDQFVLFKNTVTVNDVTTTIQESI